MILFNFTSVALAQRNLWLVRASAFALVQMLFWANSVHADLSKCQASLMQPPYETEETMEWVTSAAYPNDLYGRSPIEANRLHLLFEAAEETWQDQVRSNPPARGEGHWFHTPAILSKKTGNLVMFRLFGDLDIHPSTGEERFIVKGAYDLDTNYYRLRADYLQIEEETNLFLSEPLLGKSGVVISDLVRTNLIVKHGIEDLAELLSHLTSPINFAISRSPKYGPRLEVTKTAPNGIWRFTFARSSKGDEYHDLVTAFFRPTIGPMDPIKPHFSF